MKEETLLPFDTVSNNNNKNSTNVENNNQNTLTFRENFRFMFVIQGVILSFCFTGLILLILLKSDGLWILVISIIILGLIGLWCSLCLLTGKTLKLVKNEFTNQLTITSS